jgi:hypothetical protein
MYPGPVHVGCLGAGAALGSAGIAAVMHRNKTVGLYALALAAVFLYTSLSMEELGHCKECMQHVDILNACQKKMREALQK